MWKSSSTDYSDRVQRYFGDFVTNVILDHFHKGKKPFYHTNSDCTLKLSFGLWHILRHEEKSINLSALLLFPVVRLFGGLVMDIKRKAPFYLSDFKDGMSLQCVASFLFLYCACMSPVITFGGLLGEATEGRIVRASTHRATVQVSPHHAERDTNVLERI